MAKKQYLLVNIEEDLSKLNGSVFWRLTFLDLDDYSTWETTVDHSYRNFSRSGWDRVINDSRPFGIYEGLRQTARKTREGNGVLTADSHPDKVACVDSHAEIVTILEELQREVAEKHSRTSQFGRLFA
jgi:hypothetical protein